MSNEKDPTDFDLGSMQTASATGFDAFFDENPEVVRPLKLASRRKVAGLGDISDFVRVSNETLIHKSDRDLWAIKKDADGGVVIERMFDAAGNALKG